MSCRRRWRPGSRRPVWRHARSCADPARFGRLLELLRPRAKRLTDFVDQARPLLMDEVVYTPEAIEKHLSGPDCAQPHRRAAQRAGRGRAVRRSHRRGHASSHGVERWASKPGALIHATRVAVTGRTTSPGTLRGAGAARPRHDARPPGSPRSSFFWRAPKFELGHRADQIALRAAAESLHSARREAYANHIALQPIRNEPRQLCESLWPGSRCTLDLLAHL